MEIQHLGVIGTSRKEDEKRVPIHPDHLSRLPKDIRKKLIFEKDMAPLLVWMMTILLLSRRRCFPS